MRAMDTERLHLRPWTRDAGDREAFVRLCADAQVMRWVAEGRPWSAAEATDALDRLVAHWEERGFGLWAAVPHGAAGPVGFVGLAVPGYLPTVLPAVEVGWRLERAWWGRGLATEGARAALAWAFGPLGLDGVISIIRPENTASVRVAEKLGMGVDRVLPHPEHGWPLAVYGKSAVDAESSPPRP